MLKTLQYKTSEPYRDVTDNKPPSSNDNNNNKNNISNSSPTSIHELNKLLIFGGERTFRYDCDLIDINNFLNSSSLHHSASDSTISSLYFDVTDNRTTDTNSSSSIFKDSTTTLPSRRIIMNENLCREDERLKTFENRWPLTFMDKNILAQTGMYYTGINDNVKCYFCEVEIGRWETTDHPVNEHTRWSPNCPLLRRRSTNNNPLDAEALDRILPAPSYDVCGSNGTIDIRPGAYAESSISSIENSNSNSQTVTTPTSPGGYSYPDHPEYAIEAARLRSFAEWPRTMKQKPKELSEAGFFYTGTGDRVKCFSCGGGLKDWDESDDPWEQHALWLSNCKYLRLMKGKTYIDSIINKYKSPPPAATTKQESGNQTEDIAMGNNDDECEKQEKIQVRNVSVELNAKSANNNEAKGIANDINSEAIKKITDEKLCKICYADEYNTAFLPCGHVVACAKCASSVTKCPMCRKPFKDVMRVYFS